MNSLKEKFDNYAPQPDEKVWEEINSSLLHRRMRRRWTTASAAVAVGVGAVALLFALKNDNPSSSVAVDEVVVSENITSVSLEKNEAVMAQETVSELFHRQDAAPAVMSSDLSSPKAENVATETQSATADARVDVQHETNPFVERIHVQSVLHNKVVAEAGIQQVGRRQHESHIVVEVDVIIPVQGFFCTVFVLLRLYRRQKQCQYRHNEQKMKSLHCFVFLQIKRK